MCGSRHRCRATEEDKQWHKKEEKQVGWTPLTRRIKTPRVYIWKTQSKQILGFVKGNNISSCGRQINQFSGEWKHV